VPEDDELLEHREIVRTPRGGAPLETEQPPDEIPASGPSLLPVLVDSPVAIDRADQRQPLFIRRLAKTATVAAAAVRVDAAHAVDGQRAFRVRQAFRDGSGHERAGGR